jgi:protein-S-isoprenylcysteine O-methyltransferase Ste14
MNRSLDQLRYFTALAILLFASPNLLIWLVIHPFAGLWRRIGILRSYGCFACLIALYAWSVWLLRSWLLAVEFGTHGLLVLLSGLSLFVAANIAQKRKQKMAFFDLIGLPELRNGRPRVLVTDGIYARIRNPRYLETILAVLGCAFFANYLLVYVALPFSLLFLHLVVLLEERELRQAFGDEFSAYCDRVPRYIPKRFW